MTTEQCDEYRKVLKSYGAWDDEEIASMSKIELIALLIQEVMSEVRESDADCIEDIDWAEYEEQSHEGHVMGRLFKSGDDYYIQLDA